MQIELPSAAVATKDWHVVSLGSFARRRFPDISVSDATGRRIDLVTRKEHGEVLTRAILAGLLRDYRTNVNAALVENIGALGALIRSVYRIVTDLRQDAASTIAGEVQAAAVAFANSPDLSRTASKSMLSEVR